MNIEQIMKPYFDKKEELENKYVRDKNFLNLRLEKLRENKEQEIEEYVKNTVESNPNFYVGYGAMIRKDLEQAYLDKEQEIQKQIDSFDKFYRVDVREMVEVKEEVRKNLIAERKRLNSSLEEMKLSFDIIMNRLSNFKYIYDENHVVQNGEEYKKLFDDSHSLIDRKNEIEKQLKQIEEYISLTELTSKEIETLMRSMTPQERQEYDRRKGLNIVPVIDESVIQTLEEKMDITEKTNTEIENNDTEKTNTEIENNDTEKTNIEVENNDTEKTNIEVENYDETKDLSTEDIMRKNVDKLLDEVYTDIVGYARKLRQMPVELSEEDKKIVQLPTGMYINESDLNKAVKKYYKKEKGKTYKIEGISKEFTITKDSIKVLKEALKNCSAVELVRAKKLGSYDLKRVFARERVENIENAAKEPVEIMKDIKHYTGMPTGWYISGEEFIQKLPLLFEEKKQKWIDKLINKKEDKKLRKKLNELEKIINSKLNSNSAYARHYEKICDENPNLKEALEEFKQNGDLEQIKPVIQAIPELQELLSEMTGYSIAGRTLKKAKRSVNYDYAFDEDEKIFEEDLYDFDEPVKTR